MTVLPFTQLTLPQSAGNRAAGCMRKAAHTLRCQAVQQPTIQPVAVVAGLPSLQALAPFGAFNCMATQLALNVAPSLELTRATLVAQTPTAMEAGLEEACACSHQGPGSWMT